MTKKTWALAFSATALALLGSCSSMKTPAYRRCGRVQSE
jgi:hypothetical protein